tara:strand:+ start:6900 stop:8420 length:1521 start_codon:yes stop_codon:yes gene_type:complete
MDNTSLINTLHKFERKVLPLLDQFDNTKDISKETGLDEIEVMRAFQWMENKNILKISQELKEMADLEDNGKKYLQAGLPEKRFLSHINNKTSLTEIGTKANLSKEELSSCLGILRSKAAIDIKKEGTELMIAITKHGKSLLEKGFLEEEFITKTFPLDIKSLKEEEIFALNNLKKRKDIIKVQVVKLKKACLTPLGKELLEEDLSAENIVDRLTTSMLKTGSWKEKQFRSYDIKINVPKEYPGKKQPYRKFQDLVRKKFMSLGFKEMTGPVVETDFWNMDSLFMPQFHSARDIHDAYYVKEPRYGELDERLVKKVKEAHETGFKTGSTGWGYKFDTKRTHRHLLRTQGTACSSRMLASEKLEIPGKYFGMVRCFRSDVIDATHLIDFYQTEGIIVEEGLNFRHLKGVLKMFAEEFCQTDKIKIVPAYFPFTEPSAELHAKHPDLGWIELAGAGIFRPEMCKPLDIDVPVLAWGIGIDRIGMFNLGIKDIRQLFSQELDFLRNSKMV